MNSGPTHDEITQRAHDIWEQRGRPSGQENEHWLQAERELQNERAQAERVRRGTSGPAAAFAGSDREKPGRPPNGKA